LAVNAAINDHLRELSRVSTDAERQAIVDPLARRVEIVTVQDAKS
jgi:hypothetical protein